MHLKLNNILFMLLTLSMHECGEHELVVTCMTYVRVLLKYQCVLGMALYTVQT